MSQMLPSVSELRATQKKGMADEGMNTTDCTELNAVQGHQADIREHIDGEQLANKIHRGMIDNDDADVSRLDRTPKGSWPEITEL